MQLSFLRHIQQEEQSCGAEVDKPEQEAGAVGVFEVHGGSSFNRNSFDIIITVIGSGVNISQANKTNPDILCGYPDRFV